MESLRRVARWLGRRERITKRICFTLVAIAVAAFVVMLAAPGGMSGAVGPFAAIIAFLSLVGAILAMIVWAFCGTMAEATKPDEPLSNGLTVITESVARTNLSGDAAGFHALNVALAERGLEIPEYSSPTEMIQAIEHARHVREFSLDESNNIWGLAVRACASRSLDNDLWRAMESGADVVGGRVARLRLAPGVIPPLSLKDQPIRAGKRNFRAIDTRIMYEVGWFERAVKMAAGLAILASFIAKLARVNNGGSGGTKPPIQGWVITVFVVTILLWVMVFVLGWLRKHRASGWSIVPTPSGFRAESRRFAGRVIEVQAAECWTMIMPPEQANKRGERPSGWVFFFREEPNTLECRDFDPRGTPWENWIADWHLALIQQGERGSEDDVDSSANTPAAQ